MALPESSNLKGLRLLVVEDEALIALLIEELAQLAQNRYVPGVESIS